MFIINAAAEVEGVKHNYELSFRAHPSVEELKEEACAVFRRAGAGEGFGVGGMQIFSSKLQVWVDLDYENQLVDGCQVFIFSMETCATPETPRKPSIPFEERTGAVFQELARTHSDYLTTMDFVKGLQALRLDLPAPSLHDLFHRFDADQDGFLSIREFLNFTTKHPTLLESAHHRCIDMYKEQLTDSEVQRTHHRLQSLAEKGREKKETLRAVETHEQASRTWLQTQQGAKTLARQRDREAVDKLAQSMQSVEHATHFVDSKKHELDTARETARQQNTRVEQGEVDVKAALDKLAAADNVYAKMAADVQVLEVELELRRKDLQRCHEEQQRCSGEYAAAETRCRLAREDLARAHDHSTGIAGDVVAAENELRLLAEKERTADAYARASSLDAAREQATYDRLRSTVADARMKKEQLIAEETANKKEREDLRVLRHEQELESQRRTSNRAYSDLKEMHLIQRELSREYTVSPRPVHARGTSPPYSPQPSSLVLTEAERAAVVRARTIAAATAASTTSPMQSPQQGYTRPSSPVRSTVPPVFSPRYRPVPW